MIKSLNADVDALHDHEICLKLSEGQSTAPKQQIVPKPCKILIYARKSDDFSEMLSLLQEMIMYIN